MSVFGRDHLDYMITVPVGALRKYELWRHTTNQCTLDWYTSPGVDVMVKEAWLAPDHARRLHEILIRLVPCRRLGLDVYKDGSPFVGESLNATEYV